MTKLLVTVDVVLFTIRDRQLQLLLIRRLAKPYEHRYALPGGFVLEDEPVDDAALRELREEMEMPSGGVIFSDGVEADHLDFYSGAVANIRIAAERANLVLA